MKMFLVLFGVGVLLVGMILHVAWIAKRAEAKGRSAALWALAGIALACIGARCGYALFEHADAVSSGVLTALYVTSPFTLALAPLIAIVGILMALPAHVAGGTSWPVYHARDGAGMLVIEADAVELRWPERTDRIARGSLTATADQESLRLAWPDHEILVMPGGKPANREGRMRQASAIATRLKR